jgi:hypothetical protein
VSKTKAKELYETLSESSDIGGLRNALSDIEGASIVSSEAAI